MALLTGEPCNPREQRGESHVGPGRRNCEGTRASGEGARRSRPATSALTRPWGSWGCERAPRAACCTRAARHRPSALPYSRPARQLKISCLHSHHLAPSTRRCKTSAMPPSNAAEATSNRRVSGSDRNAAPLGRREPASIAARWLRRRPAGCARRDTTQHSRDPSRSHPRRSQEARQQWWLRDRVG